MLAKFLQSCNWSKPDDVDECLLLMNRWNEIQPGEALELLSSAYPGKLTKEIKLLLHFF
jgi:hypothetical protein